MYQIRPANIEDISQICKVCKESWLNTYPNPEFGINMTDILDKDFDSSERKESWKERISKQDAHVWIAEANEDVVGFCEVKLSNDKSILQAIYIHPKYQGLGIGTNFLLTAFDWLPQEKPIELQVATYNAQAISFYKKHGFKKIAEKCEPYLLPNGKKIPLLKMTRSI